MYVLLIIIKLIRHAAHTFQHGALAMIGAGLHRSRGLHSQSTANPMAVGGKQEEEFSQDNPMRNPLPVMSQQSKEGAGVVSEDEDFHARCQRIFAHSEPVAHLQDVAKSVVAAAPAAEGDLESAHL